MKGFLMMTKIVGNLDLCQIQGQLVTDSRLKRDNFTIKGFSKQYHHQFVVVNFPYHSVIQNLTINVKTLL